MPETDITLTRSAGEVDRESFKAHGTQHATAKTTARVNDSTYEVVRACALGA